mgnify:CR=1 FL=1
MNEREKAAQRISYEGWCPEGPYIESNIDDVTSVQLVEGYGARLSATGQLDGAVIEEIQVGGCYGTSTDVLNAEMRRAVENVSRKK